MKLLSGTSFFFVSTLVFFATSLLHSFLPLISDFNAYRWFQVVIVTCGFLFLATIRKKQFTLIFFVVALIVTSLGPAPYSFVFLVFDLGYWVSVILVALYISMEKVEPVELAKWVSVGASIGCLLYLPTIVMGVGFWYAQEAGRITDFLPFGFYGIRPWSQIATWLLPLTVVTIFLASIMPLFRHRFWKWVLITSAGFWFFVLISSGARGSLISQFLSLAFLLVFFGKSVWPIFKLWVTLFSIGFVFYLVLVFVIPSFFFDEVKASLSLRTHSSGRVELWAFALELSVRNFPLGAGPLSYIAETPVSANATPHSLYFRWAAEYGWLVVLVFIAGLVWLASPLFRQMRSVNIEKVESFQLAIIWSALAAFVHASVSGVFTSPYSLTVGFPVLIVFFVFMIKVKASLKLTELHIRGGSAAAAVLFSISIAMMPSMHSWYVEAKRDQELFFETYKSSLSPRFWLHGRYIENRMEELEFKH
ncbi:O-antigen ligase family protein [Marinobacter sp. MA]|uniref:O-antigen ligase family protein n=1 Tax=Marinobacter sp. MA TaxID=2971606 RepID=UPI003AAD9F11